LSIYLSFEQAETSLRLQHLQLFDGNARLLGVLYVTAFNKLSHMYAGYKDGDVRLSTFRKYVERMKGFLNQARSMGFASSTSVGVLHTWDDEAISLMIQQMRRFDVS
jgi:hypothetical protein